MVPYGCKSFSIAKDEACIISCKKNLWYARCDPEMNPHPVNLCSSKTCPKDMHGGEYNYGFLCMGCLALSDILIITSTCAQQVHWLLYPSRILTQKYF